ncbi:MAG: hypothetical protein JNM76_07575 [Betaproteobacteria bacterium]|nr:hypothetical protein [Betaproteobacteria bacterium]
MARLLLIAVVGVLVWLLYKGLTKSLRAEDQSPPPPAAPEDMVACSRCGVNLPKSEARLVNGVYECANSADCANRS